MVRIVYNSNKELVKNIKDMIEKNDGYCPCQLEKNEDTICPCKNFSLQVSKEKEGFCHCGLFAVEKIK